VERGGLGPVVLTDVAKANPAQGAGLVCEAVSFFRDKNEIHLKGPGRIEVSQAMMGRTDAKALKDPPLTATWEKELDVELANVVGAKGGGGVLGGGRRAPRHVLFTGRADITDTDFHIDSDLLDVLVASGVDAKGATKQVLEHLLAVGGVHVKSERQQGLGIADASKPDGINADRLEVMTAMFPGEKALLPARLLAQGNVVAWSYDPHKEGGKDTGKLNREAVYTPTFDLALAPKGRTDTAVADSRSNLRVAAKSLMASGGVIVELEGYAAQMVTATGRTLTANMEGGKDSATAVIDGEALPDGSIKYAQLAQADNKIGGEHIQLDQKTKSITIPGKGQFVFIEPGDKGKPDTPVQVTWDQKMDFDGKIMMARFFGNVDAHVFNRKDEESKLTCNKELDIQLPQRGGEAGDVVAVNKAGGKSRLRSLTALGNVVAEGSTLDEQGKIIQGLRLESEVLKYDDGRKELSVPGPGRLAIIDFRPEKTGDSANDSRGQTRFTWAGSLAYDQSGMISFDKNVTMWHQPLKPFKLPSAGDGSKPASGGPANPPLELTTDRLTAMLQQSKTAGGAAANPLSMGGGGQKLESVEADGHSIMTLGEDKLAGQTLTFDAVHDVATAEAGGDQLAEIYRPPEAMAQYRKIVWDLTKNDNAITATGIVGSVQQ